MSIETVCPQCGASHHVNDRLAGRRVRCPECDTVVHVPEIDIELDTEAIVTDDSVSLADPLASDDEPAAVEVVAVDADEAPISAAVGAVAAVPVAAVAIANGSVADSVPPADSAVQPPAASQAAIDDDDDGEDEVLSRSDLPEEEMDMTPMVDVTFLLLIFFMVTAAFSLQKSIKMPRQTTEAPSTNAVDEDPEKLEEVEVQIDEFGSFLVLAQDWERETPGKQNLITALREAIAGRKEGVQLSIKVHEAAKLHTLVDAMDAGTISGYAEVQVTQVDEFN